MAIAKSLAVFTMFDYTIDFCKELSPQCVCHALSKIECQLFNETSHLRLDRKKSLQKVNNWLRIRKTLYYINVFFINFLGNFNDISSTFLTEKHSPKR